MRRIAVSILLTVLWLPSALAGDPRDGIAPSELFPGARFDPAIPTVEQLLGHAHGSRPLRHAEVLRYLEALAESSPRASLIDYSMTHEGRRMVYLAISDAETIATLDDFRVAHARRLDPRSSDGAGFDTAKAVAWMAYGIHGDELSSVDAAVALAYRLVAGEDDRAQGVRRELVVLIDPMENPDGRDRYLALTAAFAHADPVTDLEDLSHSTVWPWGRGNHYLFDLNRDWFSQVHPESRRSGVIAGWEPQLMVDAHEMGANSSYLFSPPRHPFNPHLPPTHRKWWDRFAADQAVALDARGYDYFTGEWNEEFFPGYGSSWSAYRGALGILYEMSRTSGIWVKKRSGIVRTYPQAVEHQLASSMANLESLATHREAMLKDMFEDRRVAMESAGRDALGAWVLPRRRDPRRTDRLVSLLRRSGIEVERAAAPEIGGLRDIISGEPVDSKLLGDSWAVPLDQPAGPMVRVLLDPQVPMDAEFLREEREYLERGRGTRLYEVTAWSLLLCYGIEAYWTEELPGDGWDPKAEVTPPAASVKDVEGVATPYGYLIAGDSDGTPNALADLLSRGIVVRAADREFSLSGVDYVRGSLLIQTEGNPEDLREQLGSVAEDHRVTIEASATAKAERGPDLGGAHFLTLSSPRVGIFTGYPISPTAYGALWHLLDREVPLRFTGIDIDAFRRIDLRRYNVLVFPPAFGGADALASLLGEAGLARLRTWVEAGGTAIGIGSGAELLSDREFGLTRTRLRRQALDRYPPVVLGPSPAEAMDAGPFRAVGLRADPATADDAGTPGGGEKPSKKAVDPPKRASPYHVAPILGPGARPFVPEFEPGAELVPMAMADWVAPYLAPGQTKPDEKQLAAADERLRRFSPQGAFVLVELDPDAWLSWGLPRTLPVLVRANDTLVAEPPVRVAVRFADIDRLQLGGLVWPEAAGRLARTAYATREAVGRGQVVLFLNEPEFRGWTLGTRRLLLNALLYGPGLGTDWSSPW